MRVLAVDPGEKRIGLITFPLTGLIPVSPFNPVPLDKLIRNVSILSSLLCPRAIRSNDDDCLISSNHLCLRFLAAIWMGTLGH